MFPWKGEISTPLAAARKLYSARTALMSVPPRIPNPLEPASSPKVFGEAKDVLWVGYVLAGGEIVISLFFVLFIVVLSERLKVSGRSSMPARLPQESCYGTL